MRGSRIPSMTAVQLPEGLPVNLRPVVDGAQGRNWAVAPMLGEGFEDEGRKVFIPPARSEHPLGVRPPAGVTVRVSQPPQRDVDVVMRLF